MILAATNDVPFLVALIYVAALAVTIAMIRRQWRERE